MINKQKNQSLCKHIDSYHSLLIYLLHRDLSFFLALLSFPQYLIVNQLYLLWAHDEMQEMHHLYLIKFIKRCPSQNPGERSLKAPSLLWPHVKKSSFPSVKSCMFAAGCAFRCVDRSVPCEATWDSVWCTAVNSGQLCVSGSFRPAAPGCFTAADSRVQSGAPIRWISTQSHTHTHPYVLLMFPWASRVTPPCFVMSLKPSLAAPSDTHIGYVVCDPAGALQE